LAVILKGRALPPLPGIEVMHMILKGHLGHININPAQ